MQQYPSNLGASPSATSFSRIISPNQSISFRPAAHFSSTQQNPHSSYRNLYSSSYNNNQHNYDFKQSQQYVQPSSRVEFNISASLASGRTTRFEDQPVYSSSWKDTFPKQMNVTPPPSSSAMILGNNIPNSLFYGNGTTSMKQSNLIDGSEVQREKTSYTSALGGSVIYKSGEQLTEKFKRGDDLTQSLTAYQAEKIRSQYKQPSYLDSAVYDNYYAGHTDAEMREAELKTDCRPQVVSEAKMKLVELFKEIALIERQAEHLRQSFALQKDVSFDQVFKFFDVEGSNQITPYEVDRGLRSIGITADKIDVYLVMTRYSRDGNDSLSVSEFFEMLAPAKKDIDAGHVYQDKFIAFKDMCELSQQYFVKLMKVLLSEESMVQHFRGQLRDCGFDPSILFAELDDNKSETINRDELATWIRSNGIYVSETELIRVFHRFDRNNSGNINRAEFAYELMPKKPHRRGGQQN